MNVALFKNARKCYLVRRVLQLMLFAGCCVYLLQSALYVSSQTYSVTDSIVAANSTETVAETFTEPLRTSKNPHYFKFLINTNETCSKDNSEAPKVLIMIHTAPFNFHRRDIIRKTWLQNLTSHSQRIEYVFIMGYHSNETIKRKIQNEYSTFNDIVQGDFLGTYHNLTLMSVLMLKWTTLYCPKAEILLKVDDDNYVNIANLIKFFNRTDHRNPRTIYGHLYRKARPVRDPKSKWYVKRSEYNASYFPDYVCGCGYAITGDVVSELYKKSFDVPFVPIEDMYVTGMLAEAIGVARVHAGEFQSAAANLATACLLRTRITAHKVDPAAMTDIWKKLRDPEVACKKDKKG